jgi:FAD/FMN-containing dehydrogenase
MTPSIAREGGNGTVAGMITARQPCYRTIFAVDVESSTTRDNNAKARMRDAMYGLVTEALALNEITNVDHDPFIDSGDGLVALLRPADRMPGTPLLQSVVPVLAELLTAHNTCQPADQLRLRAVLHAGEVRRDSRGPFGEALDVAFRLLNSPATKRVLRRTAGPLVLAVSDSVFDVVRHDGIEPMAFTSFMARRNSTVWDRGWLHVPGQFPPPRHAFVWRVGQAARNGQHVPRQVLV